MDDDGQRGEAEKKQRTISCLMEQKLQKREQRLEASGARERCQRAMMSTEQQQMLQRRRQARHCTESIAENQPLEIPSFCTHDRDLIKANQLMTKSNVSVYYCVLLVLKLKVKSTVLLMLVLIMPCRSLKCFSYANSSLVMVNPSLLQQKNS